MAFEQGRSGNPTGRPPGAVGKTTATMKAAIQSVYDRLQEKHGEPHGHFLAWAENEPTEFYKLAAKLIPVQVTGEDGGPLTVSVVERKIVDPVAG